MSAEKVYTIKDSSANTITTSIAADPSTDWQYILTIESSQYSYIPSADRDLVDPRCEVGDEVRLV